jgi:hypothetical protein
VFRWRAGDDPPATRSQACVLERQIGEGGLNIRMSQLDRMCVIGVLHPVKLPGIKRARSFKVAEVEAIIATEDTAT